MTRFFNNIFTRIRDLYANRAEPEGARVLATYYWRALLIAAFVTLALSIAYGERSLFRILRDLGTAPEATLPAAPFDRASLDAVISTLQERQQTYDALKAGPRKTLTDPSR